MANLVETATQAGSFKSLVDALTATELVEFLQSPGPITILAPTDEAFNQLPEDTLNHLLQDLPTLKKVLMYHMISGDVRSDNLAEIEEAPTEEGSIVAVEHSDGELKVNEATVIKTDILADNGVIHAIDTVLMPAMLQGHS